MGWYNAKDKSKRIHPLLGKHQTDYQKQCVSVIMTGKPKSSRWKKAHSCFMKGKLIGKKNGFYGKHHPKWLLKQIGNKLKGRIPWNKGLKGVSKSTSNKLSLAMITRLQDGFVPCTRAKYKRGKTIIWMRSTWEVSFAKWMDTKKLYWEYEPEGFKTSKGRYLPDFFVYDWQSFVEIKGVMLEKAIHKIKAFKCEYPNYRLKVLRKSNLEKMGVL